MDDLISRQAVKELAHNQVREKYCDMALKEHRNFYIKLADSIIDLLPSEPHWIPCSEKPYPDTDGIYLITVRIGDSVFIEVSHFINMDGSVFWVDHDYNFGDVIAWMPAIEPYKGG